MILGVVSANLEARVSFHVEDGNGAPVPLEAIIDTGFSEYLTLPPSLIATLGLSWLGDAPVALGDGSNIQLRMYSCNVIWDSQSRTIEVHAIDGRSPLIGMKMLAGSEVRIHVVDGGPVWVDSVP
jgi:clan AA aspartic protease